MSGVRTFQIKIWLPLSILLFMLVLFGITILLNKFQDRRTLMESSFKSVQFDIAILAREVELLMSSDHDEHVSSSLMSRSVNTHYKAIFIYNLQTNEVDIEGIVSPLNKSYLVITEQDRVQFNVMRQNKAAELTYDDNSQTISAYFSIPLANAQYHHHRDGVLVARYSLTNEFAAINRKTHNQSIMFALVFVVITFAFLWVYRQFIQRPVQQLVQIIKVFSKQGAAIDPKVKGKGELREIADALQSMSEDIVTLNHEREGAKVEARQRQDIFESIFSVIPDLFFLLDENTTIIDYRVAKIDELYVPPESFLNKRMAEVLPRDVGLLFAEYLAQAITTKDVVSFNYQLPKDGQLRYFDARLAPIPKSTHVVAVVREVTQEKENELLILHQAHYDALTDLPNRYLALDRLKKHIVEAKNQQTKIAVMFLDLDDFKKVNDTLGHRVGDDVLIEIANRLVELVAETDTVARLGGDEFVIIFPNANSVKQLKKTIDMISEKLNLPIRSENRELQISASIGICTYPDDGLNATDLLRSADTAMYHAKAHGKNQSSFYSKEMNDDTTRRMKVEQCMVNALANGEYEVYYQPQFHLRNNELVGAEALLRWHSPEIGEVSPAEFIPIAEQNGQIITIGQYVIEQAIAQCSVWKKLFSPRFRIAINLSPRQFRDDSVLTYIKMQLNHYQLDGKHIEFEVTEGVLLRGYDVVHQILQGLHEAGIGISMDDFGTGYSSLSYLQDYPFDIVKIDRSFIHNMPTSEHSRELVKAIISMAHNLQLKVIAEGVETAEQASMLHAFDCDLIQGFLMGPALNKAEFLARWQDVDVEIEGIRE